MFFNTSCGCWHAPASTSAPLRRQLDSKQLLPSRFDAREETFGSAKVNAGSHADVLGDIQASTLQD